MLPSARPDLCHFRWLSNQGNKPSNGEGSGMKSPAIKGPNVSSECRSPYLHGQRVIDIFHCSI